jgi:serine/threonine-protein kinase
VNSWEPHSRIGPYKLIGPLGSGGSGDVWKARDTRLGRTVAIKRVRQLTEAFAREAQAIAAINHPHVCTLHDIGDDYLVMECVDGVPLAGPMDPVDAVALALQIVSALETAHRHGIVHRDLKPSNILVADGRAKLLDFGIARLGAQIDGGDPTLAVDTTVTGTPAYMAPEQARGLGADARSDIFSLGAVLYELVSGRRAFTGASMADILASVMRDDPPALGCAEPLSRIVQKCLEKSPDRRYQSARELRADLEGALRPPSEVPSIAVLPFANMSSDPEQEYFSDGLTEDILNSLAQIRGLRVIARTSAFAFKGRNLQLGEVARALGVANVLEGSVRRAGQRIRVTAQLVKAADGCPLWSERYDRELSDVFAVQDDIASSIVRELRGRLAPAPEAPHGYRPLMPAYEAFLMARHHVWRHTPESFALAFRCYEQAIAVDPCYADPHAGIAELLHIQASFRGPAARAAARGIRPALERALELDSSHPEALAWMGIVQSTYEYGWAEARKLFLKVTSTGPVSPRVRHLDAYFHLRHVGRADEAVAAHQSALIEDPLNLIVRVGHIACLRSARQHEEANREARLLLELAPEFVPTYTLLALDVAREPPETHLAYAERTYHLAAECAGTVGIYAGLLRRAGNDARARALMESVGSAEEYGNPVDFALFHLANGEIDVAFDHLMKLTEQHHPFLMMVLVGGPYEEAIRSSPRWPELAREIGLI